MGKVNKGVNCSVKGCLKQAVRSLNISDAKKAKLEVEANKLSRVYICGEHYKVIKKSLKKDREAEKWRREVF